MITDKYLEDIKEIKSLMNKSTRFISLSGMSGVMAGIYALIGSVMGYFIIQNAYRNDYTETLDRLTTTPWPQNPSLQILVVATAVLFLAVFTAFFLTKAQAKNLDQTVHQTGH